MPQTEFHNESHHKLSFASRHTLYLSLLSQIWMENWYSSHWHEKDVCMFCHKMFSPAAKSRPLLLYKSRAPGVTYFLAAGFFFFSRDATAALFLFFASRPCAVDRDRESKKKKPFFRVYFLPRFTHFSLRRDLCFFFPWRNRVPRSTMASSFFIVVT